MLPERRTVSVIVVLVFLVVIAFFSLTARSPIVRRPAAVGTNIVTKEPSPTSASRKELSASSVPEVTSRREASQSRHEEHADVARIQRKRQELLSKVCRQHFPKPAAVRELLSTSVNQQKDFVYCRIAKVATTTWKRTLATGLGAPRRTTFDAIMKKYIPKIMNYGAKTRTRMLRDYYKFMFVRHPFERLVSAWRNKFVEMDYRKPGTASFKRINQVIKLKYRPPGKIRRKVTFKEFIQFLLDPRTPDSDKLNRHWRPYYQLCKPCSIHYDFIGHYETLHQDAEYVLDQIGMPNIEMPHSSRRNSSRMAPRMIATLRPQQIRKLKAIFRLDFEMFGYSYDLKS